MDEIFNAERASRLCYYALRNRSADVVGLTLKAARAAGVPAGELIARAAAGEGVEWWNVSALLVRAAEYGVEPKRAHFGKSEKLRRAADDAAQKIRENRKKKKAGTPKRLDLGPLTRGEEVLALLILGEELGEEDVAHAVELVGHPYAGVRKLALKAIAARPDAEALLFPTIERLQVTFWVVCELLGELRDPRWVPQLAKLLAREEARAVGSTGQDRYWTRKAAADALAKIRDEQAIRLLASRTGEWGEIAREALRSIGRAAVPTLLRVYAEDPRWRREEAVSLARIAGADALDVLLWALRDRYRAVREDAGWGLTVLGPAAVAPLLRLLESDEELTRREAARVLGEIGDAAAFEGLARMARGADERDRRAALEALGGLSDERSLALLAESLRAPERETRRAAVAALGRRRGAVVAEVLAKAAADADRRVRLEAIEALDRMAQDKGVEAAAAAVALTGFLKDEDEEVAVRAADVLSSIGDAALKAIEEAAREAAGEHAARLAKVRKRIKKAAEEKEAEFLRRLRETAKQQKPDTAEYKSPPAASGEVSSDDDWLGDPAAEKETPPPRNDRPVEKTGLFRGGGVDKTKPLGYPGPLYRPHVQPPAEPRPAASDSVHFTVTAPRVAAPGESFVLDVWAHTGRQREEVLKRAREASRRGDELGARSKGPVAVERGTRMTVRLSVPALGVEDEDGLVWEGEIGNCNFAVLVPRDAPEGTVVGKATVTAGGASLTRLHFELAVGASPEESDDVVTREEPIRSAFASYASEERDLVLAGVHGLLKARPDLDVFLDVVTLRSGERWAERLAEEIPKRDVLYLFWSRRASASEWVQKEWRAAFEAKGIDGIDPFPLEPQGVAPEPPDELKRLHFDDPLLAFTRPAR